MLSHIQVRDFAIVDALTLELDGGLTALTGETGAGKSILVDALGFVLGDRVQSDIIRHGAEQAEVAASFDLAVNQPARDWLADHALDDDGECHLRRIMQRGGRSRGFINGRSVPIQSLRELGQRLVDIHGQHEHQSLLRREVQRSILDGLAGHGALVREVAALFARLRELEDRLQALQAAGADRAARLEITRFHLQELEALSPSAGEYDELHAEHGRLANAGRLLEAARQGLDMLYEDEPSAQALLGRAATTLEPLAGLDARLAAISELLEGALAQTQEAADALRHYLDGLDLDPQRLEALDSRIASYQQLARKHQVAPEALHEVQARLQAELDSLEHADEHAGALLEEIDQTRSRYHEQAARLSRGRRKAARQLSAAVTRTIAALGMPDGRFEVALEPLPPDQPTAHGLDRIEFLVTANAGQPPQPLGRVASGGELSRISLAIQVTAVHGKGVPTLVFDEVDTGIGGGVAEVVGRELRQLAGQGRQVLCVTHLPQVAAQAHHHLQVTKLSGDDSTRTRLRLLSARERVEELARMLGGLELTRSTRAHAREMLERAQAGEVRREG